MARILSRLLIIFVLNLIALLVSTNKAVDDAQQRRFKEVLSKGRKLMTDENLTGNNRTQVLSLFLRLPKSGLCRIHFETTMKLEASYRPKANNYVDDSRKTSGGSWFSPTRWLKGDPLKEMKTIIGSDEYLQEITERYQSQWSQHSLTRNDVDCDLAKYRIKVLNDIMYLLDTDVKLLLTDNTNIANRAIFIHLNATKFVPNEDFSQKALSPQQQDLIMLYIRNNVDLQNPNFTMESYIARVHDVGNLIIGRLRDTCKSVMEHRALWLEGENARFKSCPGSASDPKNIEFPAQYNLGVYEELTQFCDQFLKAPKPEPKQAEPVYDDLDPDLGFY